MSHQGRVGKRANPSGKVAWFFEVDGHDPATGKRRKTKRGGFKTKKQALEGLDEFRRARRAGRPTAGRTPTLAAWADDVWFPAVTGTIRPSTEASYRAAIRSQLTPTLGGARLSDIDGPALTSLYRSLGERLAPKTVKNLHAIVHRMFSDAVRWGHVAVNPADAADPPRVPRTELDTLTAEQVTKFLEHVHGDRLEALWRLLTTTGMRRAEVVGVRWQDVDLDAAALSIVQTITSYSGRLHVGETKTAGSRRQVALDAGTVAALREHRLRQLEERVAWGAGYQDHGLVFSREDGTPLRPEVVSKWFVRLVTDAGLPRVTVQTMRHTWATLALKAGVHPKVVADRLGHSSITTTLDRYSHVVEGLDREAAETVAALFDH